MGFDLNRKLPSKGKKAANLGGGKDDPLASVEYTGDLAEDCVAEFEAVATAYRNRADAEKDRFAKATDSEYWFAVCFETRDQKEEFLAAIGFKMKLLGDKYLDGKALAKALGVDLKDG